MGLPWMSLQTPLIVPEACAKSCGAQNASKQKIRTSVTECFFIVASRRKKDRVNIE
jgi:hypothetical protein